MNVKSYKLTSEKVSELLTSFNSQSRGAYAAQITGTLDAAGNPDAETAAKIKQLADSKVLSYGQSLLSVGTRFKVVSAVPATITNSRTGNPAEALLCVCLIVDEKGNVKQEALVSLNRLVGAPPKAESLNQEKWSTEAVKTIMSYHQKASADDLNFADLTESGSSKYERIKGAGVIEVTEVFRTTMLNPNATMGQDAQIVNTYNRYRKV